MRFLDAVEKDPADATAEEHAEEARPRDEVGDLVGLDEFNRAGPFEELVFGQIDFAHSARAEFGFQHVLAELPGLERLVADGVDNVRAEDGDQDRQNNQADAFLVRGANVLVVVARNAETAAKGRPPEGQAPSTSAAPQAIAAYSAICVTYV